MELRVTARTAKTIVAVLAFIDAAAWITLVQLVVIAVAIPGCQLDAACVDHTSMGRAAQIVLIEALFIPIVGAAFAAFADLTGAFER